MTDWIEHDGGRQPVASDVWVRAVHDRESLGSLGHPAGVFLWHDVLRWHVLNQHLIDAARLEGIRLGLKDAAQTAHRIWQTHNDPKAIADALDSMSRDPGYVCAVPSRVETTR